jgi:quinol monooxygenase YgiN
MMKAKPAKREKFLKRMEELNTYSVKNEGQIVYYFQGSTENPAGYIDTHEHYWIIE